jgi:alpha-N-arabinofuranosidase
MNTSQHCHPTPRTFRASVAGSAATARLALIAVVLGLAPAAQTGGAGAGEFKPPPLASAGFEDTNIFTAWRAWIYQDGKVPVVRADAENAHEGRNSLLVAAEDPADVAVAQFVSLPPGSIWRATGWVKTENLTARDGTETGGALHIQTAAAATLARGPSTFGTSPWKKTEAVFRVPPEGEVKIVLFFVGYGKGTGKAWFDDVRLEPLSSTGPETVRITSDRLTKQPIDVKQGGQFIEPLCNLIPSLLAQQVANTSFEVEPPWHVAFRRDVDKPHRPWYPDGAVHLARYTFDTNRPFNGHRSLCIKLNAPRARAGISQDGFYLKDGLTYTLRLHIRGSNDVTVRATLHGDGGLAAPPATLGQAKPEWGPAEARLKATRTIENATLTLDFEGPGTLWLDRVSLIGEDAVLGLWRPDVVRAIRELNPGVIRFGGSALESYEWDQCLGPWDQRAPFPQNYWGGIEENFVGVEEFVQLCQAVGAEPLVCLRWSGKMPADAAAEVEYFNGAPDTPMGRRRAQNGRVQPYGVTYWQIGNEVGGPAYDESVRAFAEAIRRADRSIKVLSSFPSAATLQAGGGYLDYLCPHQYGCADLPAMEQDFHSLEDRIQRFAGTRPVRIAVTEWKTTAADWDLGRAALQTLGNALHAARYHHLMHRHADFVEIAIRSNLIDSFGSGVILTGPGWMYFAPTFYAQQLYARAAGSYPVRIARHVGNGDVTLPWHLEEPDLSAALSADGRTLRVYAVNTTDRPLLVRATLDGFSNGVAQTTRFVLRDSERSGTSEVLNTRDEPERVRIFTESARWRGVALLMDFEPFSVTLYEIDLQ